MMMMMISLYKKSVHTLLSFTRDTVCPKNETHNSNSKLQQRGLGLICDDDNNSLMQSQSPNILQSSSLLLPTKPREEGPGRAGFESSDQRLVSDGMVAVEEGVGCMPRLRPRRVVERELPPPLSTFNHHGQPSFYLRPVRKDGRLELTQVRIERTDVLRACRGDGRLRLHLIKDHGIRGNQEEGFVKEEAMEFRRCVEPVNQQRRRQHHHRHFDVWRQPCLTTT